MILSYVTFIGVSELHFDTILLHQVLHFALEPELALTEASRVIKPGGRIAIVDFAAHDREELRERHAHARLGFSDKQVRQLLRDAGFKPSPSHALDEGELVVKIWVGKNGSGRAGELQQEKRA